MIRPLHSQAPRRSQGGHTLWEMLFVLALLGVITALVAPWLGLRATAREAGTAAAADEIVSLLAQARVTALERGNSVEVVIDPASARVWSFSFDRGERRFITAGTLRLPPGAMLTAAAPRVWFTFDAGGTASGGPIVVRGIEGSRTVVVDPWSGVANAIER